MIKKTATTYILNISLMKLKKKSHCLVFGPEVIVFLSFVITLMLI